VLLASQGCASGQLEALLAMPYLEPNFERSAPLMAPDNLRNTSSSNREIGLAWDPVLVGDVAGYTITRSDRPEGPFSLVGRRRGRFTSVFRDAGEGPMQLGDGATYYYEVRAFDTSGSVGSAPASIAVRTDPRPSVPPGFQAYSSLPRRIALAWEPSLSSSVVGYTLYRSPSLGGTFDRIAYIDGRLNTVHEDTVPGDLRVMYYKLQAVNRFGATSDLVEPVRAVTKPEPLPPIGLQATPTSIGRIDLRWDSNVEPDLARYQIWRELDAQASARPIASVDATTTEYSDRSLGCGQQVRYWLRAIDRDGLESDFSRPLEVTALDLDLQLQTDASRGPTLRWEPAHAQGWPTVRLTQQRTLLPDRELGSAPTAAGVLPVALPSGRYAITATLMNTRPGGAAATPAAASNGAFLADAPPCRAQIQIP